MKKIYNVNIELSEDEIRDAIVEYIKKKGIDTRKDFIDFEIQNMKCNGFPNFSFEVPEIPHIKCMIGGKEEITEE